MELKRKSRSSLLRIKNRVRGRKVEYGVILIEETTSKEALKDNIIMAKEVSRNMSP